MITLSAITLTCTYWIPIIHYYDFIPGWPSKLDLILLAHIVHHIFDTVKSYTTMFDSINKLRKIL